MNKVKLTPEQTRDMEIARVGFMNQAPFFAYYFYSEMVECPTLDIPSAATDGRRVFYNPEYMSSLKPPERVFILAHEVYHVISRHPARTKHYSSEGNLRTLPWSHELFNIAADLIINADLIKNDIGLCNPAWLYDPGVTPEELVEDLYEKIFKKNPPPKGGRSASGSAPGAAASATGTNNPTYGDSRKGGKPDPQAQGAGGRFDNVLPPQVDPVTGKEDLPDEAEFKEAVARAATAAKAMGKMPASLQRIVDEILEPQISWREHIRMLVTGRIGSRHETWNNPNRRRLALARGEIDKMVVLPGRRGFGARDVAVAVDTSGSIGQKELNAFFAEVGGILADVHPQRIFVIWCDAKVQGVDEVKSLEELGHVKANPKGGGGTDFRPPFQWLDEHDIRPEAMVYLTDLMGPFPDEAPRYPVIWCATTDQDVPWGEVVRIKI